MKKYQTKDEVEAAVISGEISTTSQLHKALAILEINIDGNSRMSMEVSLNFNDMRKAAAARLHDLPRLKKRRKSYF